MLTRRQFASAALLTPLLEPVHALAAEARRVRITNVESFRVHVPPAYQKLVDAGLAEEPEAYFRRRLAPVAPELLQVR